MSVRRKISRNLNFSYRPSCHHCVFKLSALFKRFSIDHKIIPGRIGNECACRIEGKAIDKLVIRLIRNMFKKHKERDMNFLQDIECTLKEEEE